MLMLITTGAEALEVSGLWMTEDGEGAVEIEPCGEARCGHIVWLKEPFDAAGQPIRDVNNPSPSERQRPLCGAEIISGLRPQDDGSWDDGSIYDPEEGKSYSLMIKADGNDRLKLRGYIGIRAAGETVIWTRGAEHLGRCQPVESTGSPQ
jgi:uncharacterized protein (DUF2147 family)